MAVDPYTVSGQTAPSRPGLHVVAGHPDTNGQLKTEVSEQIADGATIMFTSGHKTPLGLESREDWSRVTIRFAALSPEEWAVVVVERDGRRVPLDSVVPVCA